MKKTAILAIAALVLVSCVGHKTPIEREIGQYAVVKVQTPDLSGITDNGKEVLNLYRFAAYEADNIYWKQYFGDKSLVDGFGAEDLRNFANINYGPWDRLSGKPFVEGYGTRPLGVNFYPVDMTKEEFEGWDNPDKNSPYTLVRRKDDGSLETVWFHDEYSDEVAKIATYLKAAADITIKPSVRNYLLKKAEALANDSYYDSDLAWLEMEDSKMDLVIGPNEKNDDQLFGVKRSYGALVLLKDESKTASLLKYAEMIPELQKQLPCPDEYKQFIPGSNSNVFVCDALYYGGSYNAGIKEIAINLPYDEKVQAERGTRAILLGNVIDAKFNYIISPVADLFLASDASNVSRNAFFVNLAFREIAHGLGVLETVNGKGSVDQALGTHALTWEKAKDNVVGAFLASNLLAHPDLAYMVTKENSIATFVVSLLRSQRFGEGEATGRGNMMVLNYLVANGALTRNASDKYIIDYAKTQQCLAELSGIILKTQAEGDLDFAVEFEKKYGGLPKFYTQDKRMMGLENIPIDVVFDFQK